VPTVTGGWATAVVDRVEGRYGDDEIAIQWKSHPETPCRQVDYHYVWQVTRLKPT
jgi:hypothetical protein